MSDNASKALYDMTPEELIAHFGKSPASWACHGVGMLRAAYVMWRVFWDRSRRSYQNAKAGQKLARTDVVDTLTDHSVHAYRLLAAVAMENMAKGLVIAKRKLVIKNHELPSWFVKHDIVNLLCQGAGFKLNEQERMTLTDSTKAIKWQTRYPMPKDSTHLPTQWPAMEFAQRFNHPTDFRDLATRILHDYPDEAFHASFVSANDLVDVLKLECPEAEALKG